MRKDNIKPITISEDFTVTADTHIINVSIAKEVGLVESILLSHFYMWTQLNASIESCQFDDKTWFYKSSAQICEIYPYLSQEKVKRAIERLVQSGLLYKRVNVDNGLLKANWYSLSDKVISWYASGKIPNAGYNTQRKVQYPTSGTIPNKDNNNIVNNNKDIFIEKENILKEKDISFDSPESNARDLFSDMAAEDFADYDTPTFDAFWNLYDKKMGKIKVKAKWDKLSKADKKAIMDYLPKYVESTPDKQYRKHPLTFLNQEGWNDEIIEHKTLCTSDNDRKSTSSNVLRATDSSGDTDPSDIKRWEEPARKCVEWMQSNDIHFSMTTQDFRSCYEYVEGCVKAMAAILMQYKGVQFPGFVKLEVDKRRREEPFSSMISEYVREHNSHK